MDKQSKKTKSLKNLGDFFEIGAKAKPKLLAIEEVKDWKNIRPKQDYDAINKQVFKKRKYDER